MNPSFLVLLCLLLSFDLYPVEGEKQVVEDMNNVSLQTLHDEGNGLDGELLSLITHHFLHYQINFKQEYFSISVIIISMNQNNLFHLFIG